MATDPKRVLHTSPDTLDDTEKRFITRYPIASAPTDIIATAASPLILMFCPVRSSRIAAATVTGSTKNRLFEIPTTDATAIAPNATCESPSPIKENLLSTNITPSKDAESAISTPTTRTYLING